VPDLGGSTFRLWNTVFHWHCRIGNTVDLRHNPSIIHRSSGLHPKRILTMDYVCIKRHYRTVTVSQTALQTQQVPKVTSNLTARCRCDYSFLRCFIICFLRAARRRLRGKIVESSVVVTRWMDGLTLSCGVFCHSISLETIGGQWKIGLIR